MDLRPRQDDQTADPRTLAVAVRTSLQLLAEKRPLPLAVDDLQWLDPSSESVLAFEGLIQSGSS
jgi:predicted ATPase